MELCASGLTVKIGYLDVMSLSTHFVLEKLPE